MVPVKWLKQVERFILSGVEEIQRSINIVLDNTRLETMAPILSIPLIF